jgi:outer membrane immunogenic protein
MKGLFLAVAAALALSAGQAAAEGLPSKGGLGAAAGPNWNGFYIGAGIGGGQLDAESAITVSAVGVPPVEPLRIEDRGDGIFGIVTLGYDRVIRPGWVAGVFADYDFASNISAKDKEFGLRIDHNYSWAVGARLGFLADAFTLLYATAGYTQAELQADVDGNGIAGVSGASTFDGYFVGAGFETFLRQNWTLKLEYRYSNFGEETVFNETVEGPIPGLQIQVRDDLDPATHTARLVLSYRFGRSH